MGNVIQACVNGVLITKVMQGKLLKKFFSTTLPVLAFKRRLGFFVIPQHLNLVRYVKRIELSGGGIAELEQKQQRNIFFSGITAPINRGMIRSELDEMLYQAYPRDINDCWDLPIGGSGANRCSWGG